MRVRAAVVCAALIVLPSCTGGGDGFEPCQPQERLVGVQEMAAPLAHSCLHFIEIDGVPYSVGSCDIDTSYLGPVTARSQSYVARSIRGTPEDLAVAIRLRESNEERSCDGWGLSVPLDLTNKQEKLVKRLACEVYPPDSSRKTPRFCHMKRSNGGVIPDGQWSEELIEAV